MNSLDLLQQADKRLVDLVSTLSVSNLDAPSPCSGWSVRSLLSQRGTARWRAASSVGHYGFTPCHAKGDDAS